MNNMRDEFPCFTHRTKDNLHSRWRDNPKMQNNANINEITFNICKADIFLVTIYEVYILCSVFINNNN